MSIATMVEAIITDSKAILPVATLLDGEFGIEGVFLGVPAVLGKNGLEQVVEIDLSDDELKALKDSADYVQENMDAMHELRKKGH